MASAGLPRVKFLFRPIKIPPMEECPRISIRYASLDYALHVLPAELGKLIRAIASGLTEPRVTYRCVPLGAGQCMGPPRLHKDGRQQEAEIHRLFTWGDKEKLSTYGFEPVSGQPLLLAAGSVYEYGGDFLHRALPANVEHTRMIIRVSQTTMKYRNFFLEEG